MNTLISKASGANIAEKKTHRMIALARRVLFILLIASVSVSALIAIVSILTAGFDENTAKAVGTSGIIAGVSLLLILQTNSIQRLKVWDFIVSALGLISSLYILVYLLDMLYGWNFINSILTDMEFSNKFNVTVMISAGALALTGLLMSAVATKVTRIASMITIALVIVDAGYIIWNNWTNWEMMMNEGWSKFWAIINILLGVGFIVTLILNLVGRSKYKGAHTVAAVAEAAKAAEIAKAEDANKLLKPDTVRLLKKEAQFREMTEDALVKKLLEENPAHRPFI